MTERKQAPSRNGITRRKLLQTTGAGAAVGAAGLFGGKAPLFAQQREIHTVQWSHFVPQADEELRRQADEFTKQTGVRVRLEHINLNDVTTRATSAVEGGQGADIFQLQWNQPHLFANGLRDHDNLVADVFGSEDRIYSFLRQYNKVDGTYRGMPYFAIPWVMTYRTDFFAEAGVTEIPQTWDELLQAGKKLKEMGTPIGQTLGHTIGDAPFFTYALLWCFGGMEVDENQNVIIDSAETRQSVEFLKEFWFAACDEGGLAWDDSSNNRAFMASTIAACGNASSIYLFAKNFPDRVPEGMAEKIDHFLLPEGPAGRYMMSQPYNYNIMKHTPNPEACEEFLKFIMQEENYHRWMVSQMGFILGPTPQWQEIPEWEDDPKITVFRQAPDYGRTLGHAGPPNRDASEAQARYIVTDLYARSVRGDNPGASASWAQNELERVYES